VRGWQKSVPEEVWSGVRLINGNIVVLFDYQGWTKLRSLTAVSLGPDKTRNEYLRNTNQNIRPEPTDTLKHGGKYMYHLT
jgi:hypothetical protein